MFRHLRPLVAAVVVSAVASLSCSGSTEPNPENLRVGVPRGWFAVGGSPQQYQVGIDPKTVHGGSRALAILGGDTSRARFGGVGQSVQATDFLGKRVRFRAWIRQSSIVGTAAGLWMRVDGPGVMQAFDNFSTRPQLGTSDWHQVEVILDIPTNAIGIAFGVLMSGRGELFADDMEFEIIPPNGPTTNQLFEPVAGTDSATAAANYARVSRAVVNLDFEAR